MLWHITDSQYIRATQLQVLGETLILSMQSQRGSWLLEAGFMAAIEMHYTRRCFCLFDAAHRDPTRSPERRKKWTAKSGSVALQYRYQDMTERSKSDWARTATLLMVQSKVHEIVLQHGGCYKRRILHGYVLLYQ